MNCIPTLLNSIADTTPGLLEEVEALWMVYRVDFQQELYDLAWNRLADKLRVARDLIEKDPLGRLWVQAWVYFVGIRKRREVVNLALGRGGGVFGDESWAGILGNGVYKGRVAYGNELRKVYNESAFVLEVRQPQNRTGLTQRIFDASACGRPVLAEWSPEIDYLFNGEEDILCFHNLEEAREGRERYLEDPEDARAKGDRARQNVLAHHTFRHRAREILQVFHQF